MFWIILISHFVLMNPFHVGIEIQTIPTNGRALISITVGDLGAIDMSPYIVYIRPETVAIRQIGGEMFISLIRDGFRRLGYIFRSTITHGV